MNERKGYPSASGIERITLCPGSWHMEQRFGITPTTDPTHTVVEDQWATSGRKIHEALAGIEVHLTHEEEVTKEKCRDLENELILKVFREKPELTSREIRLWLNDPLTLDPLMSGRFDTLHLVEHHALILDYKTGRGDVMVSPSNKQLRALAVLVKQHFNVTRVTVGIIQPWVSPQTSLCEYTTPDLELARTEIILALTAARSGNAPLIPGPTQCTHCRANAFCPSAWHEIDTLGAVVLHEAPGQMISGKDVSSLLERWTLCKRLGSALEAHAKHRLEIGQDVPGWKLTEGRTVEEITDPQLVFERCHKRGVTPDRFMSAVKILKGELKTVLQGATKIKGDKLDIELAKVLDGATESKRTAGSLVRIKGE